jgi:dihydroorotase
MEGKESRLITARTVRTGRNAPLFAQTGAGSGGGSTQGAGRFDLLLKGGEVVDPASGNRGQFDVAFAGGKVAAIRPNIDPSSANRVESAAGAMVVPGLIDLHAHPAAGIGEGVNPDAIGIARGATTVADGGTCGTGTFGAFRPIMAASTTRLFAWLNLASIGQADTRIGELSFLAGVDVEEAVALARKHPDSIVGFKARLSTYVTGGGSALRPLKLLLEAGEAARLPVMIHVGDTAEPLGRILDMLRPGDVVSHYLTSRKHNLLGIQASPGATIIPEAFAARERGVILDTARGRNHMAFPQMQAAVERGLLPDTFSTDLAVHTAADPDFSLMAVATQFMSFGLSFEDCLVRMTVNPAKVLRHPEFGILAVDGVGDATLLRIENGTFRLRDADGRTRTTDQRLVAVGVVRAGEYVGITPPQAS